MKNPKELHLYSALPEPTKEMPHIQIDWVWHRFARQYKNAKTLGAYKSQLNYYKHFLCEMYGFDDRLEKDPRFYLSVHWDHFAIYNAEKYFRQAGYSSALIAQQVGCLKQVIRFAVAQGLTHTSDFIYPRISVRRETKRREPYTEDDLIYLQQIISEMVREAARIAVPYKITGIGSDPRSNSNRNEKTHYERWGNWENIVWFFENVLNCKPVIEGQRVGDSVKGFTVFVRAAKEFHGGMENVWRRLGVSVKIGKNLLVPLIMKLAWETGLNPDSLLSLKRDCYQPQHTLTGLPYIKYYKGRSTGDKELHLSLFDHESQLHLLPKQSEVINKTVDLISKLTETLVRSARPEDKDYLLLFQSNAKNNLPSVGDDGVRRVNLELVSTWAKTIKKKAREAGRSDILESLTLGRFRPTKITQMVRDGYDFFRIQAAAGHASVATTVRYLSTRELDNGARREVSAALVQIHRNFGATERNSPPYASADNPQQPGFIYKGIITDCKNVYDPPKQVRNLRSYQIGQSCTYWNMCLFCPNVIITKAHLPRLIGLSNSIKLSMKDGNLCNAPNATLYRKMLAVIEGIFAEFPEKDLRRAERIEESSDFYFDGALYKGITHEEVQV